uniref:hypothetical protein n=1 Tax=Halomonas sp. TaxID=1486246 RepID=UPI002618F93B|nr:hypothetical protein [Halomonas sp.]
MKKSLIATALVSLLATGGAFAMDSAALQEAQATLSETQDTSNMSAEDRLTSLENQVAAIKMLLLEAISDN